MEYNERNITAEEVFKKLEEVERQNKEILEKLENMQKSNALFHNGFATIFEVLRGLNEVKQNEDYEEILKTGLIAQLVPVICAESWGKKHRKTTSKSKVEKEKDAIELLKMLENI